MEGWGGDGGWVGAELPLDWEKTRQQEAAGGFAGVDFLEKGVSLC